MTATRLRSSSREAVAGYLAADRAADVDRRIVEAYARRPHVDLISFEAAGSRMVARRAVGRAHRVNRGEVIPVLNAVLVAPATRTARGIPTDVALSADDGMPEDCVLTFDNIYTVPKGHLTSRITRLGPAKLAELCAALDVFTDC